MAKKNFSLLNQFKVRDVIYGVTDQRDDPFLIKLNNFLIDHSPVRLKEKSLLFQSLRLLIASGIRFTRALHMLAERNKNLRLKRILKTILYDMENNGLSFSRAMQKYPDVFAWAEIKMIYSGEVSGELENSLASIAKQLQKSLELDIRVKSALLYPATVMVAIVIAAIIIMLVVIPKFENLFMSLGSDKKLPLATNILINSSNFFINYWWFIVTVIFGGGFIFQNWKNSETGKLKWDGFLLKMPIFKNLINNIQTIKISSNFSTLLKSGVPVTKSLKILSEIIPNAVISDAIFDIEHKVQKGTPMFQCFKENKIFDPILGEIIEIGEKGGRVSEILEKTSGQYELEVDAQLKNLTSLIEPIVIFIVGGAVVFIAMAILMPIFQMQEIFSI